MCSLKLKCINVINVYVYLHNKMVLYWASSFIRTNLWSPSRLTLILDQEEKFKKQVNYNEWWVQKYY